MPQSYGDPRMAGPRSPAARAARVRVVALPTKAQVLNLWTALVLMTALLLSALPLRAADRDKVAAFASVTGYDVVIKSLQRSAAASAAMAGNDTARFAQQYAVLAREVFDPELLHNRALDLLSQLLSDELLHAGADFYATELGQRLVEVENHAHETDYASRQAEGARLVADLSRSNPARIEALGAMNDTVGNDDLTIAGLVEMQTRFILAAQMAGSQKLDLSEPELRQQLQQLAKSGLPEMRRSGVVSAAWTYRDISDSDLMDYLAALQTPEMTELYLVLNKVQFQVMVEFYEKLGARLGEIVPETDL